jgi:1-acyl-sn-glycerol-3-phosphate acyltransferase
MIHIDRSDARHAFASITRQGQQRTDEGAWVVMFPEGTRTAPGQQVKYKTGGARFAVALGLPVIPVAHNAGHVWPRNSFIKYPGMVTVSIGKPISTAGLCADEVNQRVEAWIEAEMRRIDPQAYPQVPQANMTDQH